MGEPILLLTATPHLGESTSILELLKFLSGVTLTVDFLCKYLIIEADTIIVSGIINGSHSGEYGGTGGVGGAFANGSGNPGRSGQGGTMGSGPGGGTAGASGEDGETLTQICGNFLCIGNRDGLNGGGGGSGGGGGGSYGGISGSGGFGAYGAGFTQASGGLYGSGGLAVSSYGTESGIDITWGSGGGGGGGGGGGWNTGTSGGAGGKGGAMVQLKSHGPLSFSGNIWCNGENGQHGGNGGGASTAGSFVCSSSGYSACGVCNESVFDASGGAGGGAGGGSGGGILIMAHGDMVVTGEIQAKGGNGGMAGNPRSTHGTCFDNARGGGGGGGGRVKIFSNPCSNNAITPTISVIGGTGGDGGYAGIDGNNGTKKTDLEHPNYTALSAGTITLIDPNFCVLGDVPQINCSGQASGGIPGNISYQWQFSTTSSSTGFNAIPNQVSPQYDPSTITQTTWYRRKAISGSCEEFSNVVVATVTTPPTVSISGLNSQYCDTDPDVTLIGNPPGGIFAGNGVSQGVFKPSVAGVGVHPITYTYIIGGCTIQDTKNVSVVHCTSVETTEQQTVLIYPNPAQSQFYIELAGFFSGQIHIQIIDYNGKKVFEKIVNDHNQNSVIHITHLLPSGTYHLIVQDKENHIQSPLIIQ
jgi:hypothetical protein